MSLFNSILNSIQGNINKNNSYKKDIILIINKNLNLKIEEDSINIYKNTLNIKTTPTIKNAILLKKDILLKELNSFNIKNIN